MTPNNNTAYVSQSGWTVETTDPHAGDKIDTSPSRLEVDVGLLVPHTGGEECGFCPSGSESLSDYDIKSGGVVLASACHACVTGCPVEEEQAVDFSMSEVYNLNTE